MRLKLLICSALCICTSFVLMDSFGKVVNFTFSHNIQTKSSDDSTGEANMYVPKTIEFTFPYADIPFLFSYLSIRQSYPPVAISLTPRSARYSSWALNLYSLLVTQTSHAPISFRVALNASAREVITLLITEASSSQKPRS